MLKNISSQFAVVAALGVPIWTGGLAPAACASTRVPGVLMANGAIAPSSGGLRQCAISDLASLRRCFAKPNAFDRFIFKVDVACNSSNECCAGDKVSLMRLDGLRNKQIDGAGHTLRRRGGQRACPAIQVLHSDGILVSNLSLDEDETAPPCELADAACPSTVQIDSARDIKLDAVHIYFGKGYVVRVWNTKGFAFAHSSISDAGMIGLYVGHYKFGPSSNIAITNSVVAHSRTNGIALQGAISADASAPVLVQRTILSGNHWHGLWPVANILGGITSGGQLLVADGRNIRIADDVIAEGACENCIPPRQTVPAVEIADQAPPPAGVFGLVVEHNVIFDGGGVAIYQNPGTAVAEVTISDNRLEGYSKLDSVVVPANRARNFLAPATFDAPANAYRAIRFTKAGRHHIGRSIIEARDANVEGVFEFSPSPRPGAAVMPLFRCVEDGQPPIEAVSTSLMCDGHGQANALLGYSYEPHHPNAKPFYACRVDDARSDFFLSWDRTCEGRRVIGKLGFAVDAMHARP